MHCTYQGFLFDVYNVDEEIHLWLITADGRRLHFTDVFYPVVFARGPAPLLEKLLERLRALEALRSVRPARRVLFYENRAVDVLEITLSRPAVLPRIRRKLYAFYGRMDLYHSDIELTTAYMLDRKIFPLAWTRLDAGPNGEVLAIRCQDDIASTEYRLPDLRTLALETRYSHRTRPGPANPLIVRVGGEETILDCPLEAMPGPLNRLLERHDPDVILTAFGDQSLLPALLGAAERAGVNLALDRDPTPAHRRFKSRGNSFMTYGSWIYRAPSLPLFGRWHIDSGNTFVFKEAELAGTIELARLSRMPVQRMARASTGMALTAIETEVALEKNYLVPWQKSAAEETKTFYQLMRVDKGGMIFAPDTTEGNVRENVAQVDFSQMYPSIMALHNISPETVQCDCCRADPAAPRVPVTGSHLCVRRRGVVAEALDRLLERRRYYKQRLKEPCSPRQREQYDQRQSSLKWMFVTSFGYLGFRNAKFGRLESHEAVTAFGREKMLLASEIAAEHGFQILHGITDCLFLTRPELDATVLQELCAAVEAATGVALNVEGLYRWVVFLPSRQDPDLPVINRYFGLFENGELKFRGIAARRKDVPALVRSGQLKLLGLMSTARTVAELRALHPTMDAVYREIDDLIRAGTDWRNLLVRRTVSRAFADYKVAGGTFSAVAQIRSHGSEVSPGEKVRFLVRDRKHPDPAGRYLAEETIAARHGDGRVPYDVDYYRGAWLEAYREVWECFAPEGAFARLPETDQGELF